MDTRTTRSPWNLALITLAVLVIAAYSHEIFVHSAAYRQLHSQHPFYVAESIDKISGAILCIAAVWLLRRVDLRDVLRELGLSAPILPAFGFALIVSLPMLIGFVVTRSLSPGIGFFPLLFLTVFSPVVEELEFRGFGIRQLQRGTGWSFWVVVWPSALLFGLVHTEKGGSLLEMTGLFLLTGVGGVILAWLVYRWQNLWVAVALHVCINLWWELFSVSKTAIGGWFPFALQTLTILLAVVVTLYWTRPKITDAAPST